MKPIDLDILSVLKQSEEDYGHDDLETVEEGEWKQDYKYQFATEVVQHLPTGRFFAIHRSRSGSPFTDWDYSDPYFTEVAPVTKTITVTTYEDLQ